jgi:8-oxo-dGTP pyrophosphatase MutT (NUDIX family)
VHIKVIQAGSHDPCKETRTRRWKNMMAQVNTDIKNVVVIGLINGLGATTGKRLFVVESDGAIRFPGGKVKSAESLQEALDRELREEIGIEHVVDHELAIVEHAGVFDRIRVQPTKSILLYFFDVIISPDQIASINPHGTWLDLDQVNEKKDRIPYDNFVIMSGFHDIDLNENCIVPPGFQDTPRDKKMIVIRNFCWMRENK